MCFISHVPQTRFFHRKTTNAYQRGCYETDQKTKEKKSNRFRPVVFFYVRNRRPLLSSYLPYRVDLRRKWNTPDCMIIPKHVSDSSLCVCDQSRWIVKNRFLKTRLSYCGALLPESSTLCAGRSQHFAHTYASIKFSGIDGIYTVQITESIGSNHRIFH